MYKLLILKKFTVKYIITWSVGADNRMGNGTRARTASGLFQAVQDTARQGQNVLQGPSVTGASQASVSQQWCGC